MKNGSISQSLFVKTYILRMLIEIPEDSFKAKYDLFTTKLLRLKNVNVFSDSHMHEYCIIVCLVSGTFQNTFFYLREPRY